MTNKEIKKFKVVRILNTDYIVIDGGKKQGVNNGDRVKVFSPNFVQVIKDLDGMDLDRIPTPKDDQLEVVTTYDNSAICAGVIEKNPVYRNLALDGLYNAFKGSVGRKELNVKIAKAHDLPLDASPIDIGDIAEVLVTVPNTASKKLKIKERQAESFHGSTN